MIKKLAWPFVFACLQGFMYSQPAEEKPTEIINDIKNYVLVNGIIADGDCTKYMGTSFMECMAWLNNQQLKEHFKKLEPRVRRYYLDKLSKNEKKEFISHFSDQEWHDWWQQLPPASQAALPASKKEFIKAIESEGSDWQNTFKIFAILGHIIIDRYSTRQ